MVISLKLKQLLPLDLQEFTYVGEIPSGINKCIVITETGGPHGTYFSQGHLNEPYIKVSVQDLNYESGYSLIQKCKQIFTSYAQSQVLSIILKGDITYFGRDELRRNLWQLTYKIFEGE